jgi:outer membrane immunogenic protein
MKTLSCAGVLLCGLALPAMAADMGVPYAPAPVPVVIGWTGLYIGANLGWVESNKNLINTATDTGSFGLGSLLAANVIPGTVGGNRGGFIGGGQIGYNWQFSPNWVAGLEADFAGLGNDSSTSVFAFPGGGFAPLTTTFTGTFDTLGTVRGRLGWLFTPTMLAYATTGLAYGETKVGSSFTCSACLVPAAVISTSSGLATGWTVGAGFEWQFAPQWSVKAEYLYVDLGSRSTTINYAYAPFNSTLTTTVDERDNVVRVGLNYRFW